MNHQAVVDNLIERVAALSRNAQEALFTCLCEALMPLYRDFGARVGWNDSGLVEELVQLLRGRIVDSAVDLQFEPMVETLESVTPHSDDFDTIEVFYAMDAIGCLDAALRIAAGQRVYPDWVEYALDPMQVYMLSRDRGIIAPGGSANDLAMMDELYQTDEMRSVVACVENAINLLRAENYTSAQLDNAVGLLVSIRPIN
ncbi:DUF416 family protein [Kutzneria sp. 744]|uniref:DUF416 family protein n=1 Tax=Kutzneria sp. (strain 744) TaxID=345341 RepID=UPI0003EECA27|nr:DUF416 family protein [Kutzneria sp. 744]EWM17833.1 hypothetical protein KUTG_08137 [Kutzneria sp. 744]